MPIRLSGYVKRPEHVVVCAVPDCGRFGLRESACWVCGEYRCPAHVEFPIQGHEFDHDRVILTHDPKDLDHPR
jgi:hypothetical protein